MDSKVKFKSSQRTTCKEGSKLNEDKLTVCRKTNVRRLENELRRTKADLKAEKTKTMKVSSVLKLNDIKYKKQQESLDKQLEGLISKLLLLEGSVRREQQDIEDDIQVKDETISKQGQRISRLERINAQLKEEIMILKGEGEGRPGLDTTIKSARAYLLETLDEEITC